MNNTYCPSYPECYLSMSIFWCELLRFGDICLLFNIVELDGTCGRRWLRSSRDRKVCGGQPVRWAQTTDLPIEEGLLTVSMEDIVFLLSDRTCWIYKIRTIYGFFCWLLSLINSQTAATVSQDDLWSLTTAVWVSLARLCSNFPPRANAWRHWRGRSLGNKRFRN